MTDEALAIVVALTGFIGGLAGLIAAVWTIVWAVTLRPRVRWSLNRFDIVTLQIFSGPPQPYDPNRLETIQFYFRNTGTAAADDAHIVVKGGHWERATEFPPTGRQRIAPGEEIVVQVQAKVLPNATANRPYPSGDDAMFDLAGVKAKVRWRRQTWGFATRRFDLNKQQTKVPFV